MAGDSSASGNAAVDQIINTMRPSDIKDDKVWESISSQCFAYINNVPMNPSRSVVGKGNQLAWAIQDFKDAFSACLKTELVASQSK